MHQPAVRLPRGRTYTSAPGRFRQLSVLHISRPLPLVYIGD
jgi:hypothetical protein